MHIELINKVCNLLDTKEVYMVGGSVRDILLNKEPKDYDFCTPLLPDELENKIRCAGRRVYNIGKKFGTVGCKIEIDGKYQLIEITTYRSEVYKDTRKPIVEFEKELIKDLSRRDFTVNSMVINNKGKVIDYFGGKEDLKHKVIKAVGKPKDRFKEDPLRMLRAIRLANKLNFSIDATTYEYIKKMRFELYRVSKERWVSEIDQIFESVKIDMALTRLMDTGLLGIIVPELSLQLNYDQNSPYHRLDLWKHTKMVTESVPAISDMRWSALLHDIGKPFTRTENKKGYSNYINHELMGAEISLKVSEYLKFSNNRKNFIFNTIINHLDDHNWLRKYDNAGK